MLVAFMSVTHLTTGHFYVYVSMIGFCKSNNFADINVFSIMVSNDLTDYDQHKIVFLESATDFF